jgi:catalase
VKEVSCNARRSGVAAALKALASQPSDPFKPAQPEADFPTATPGAEDIEL